MEVFKYIAWLALAGIGLGALLFILETVSNTWKHDRDEPHD
jgi:hypothetical protein